MIHIFFTAFLLSFGAIFPIINPVGHAPLFYIMTISNSVEERRRMARRVAFYVFLILLVSLLTGEYILRAFGITINDIRIAGGLLVGAVAWKMLDNDASITDKERSSAIAKDDIALTPMATPVLAGPGAMSLAIGMTSFGAGPIYYAGYIAGFAAVGVITVASFYSADSLAKWLGHTGMGALNRILGFLILAIGVDLMVIGIKNCFYSHA